MLSVLNNMRSLENLGSAQLLDFPHTYPGESKAVEYGRRFLHCHSEAAAKWEEEENHNHSLEFRPDQLLDEAQLWMKEGFIDLTTSIDADLRSGKASS